MARDPLLTPHARGMRRRHTEAARDAVRDRHPRRHRRRILRVPTNDAPANPEGAAPAILGRPGGERHDGFPHATRPPLANRPHWSSARRAASSSATSASTSSSSASPAITLSIL